MRRNIDIGSNFQLKATISDFSWVSKKILPLFLRPEWKALRGQAEAGKSGYMDFKGLAQYHIRLACLQVLKCITGFEDCYRGLTIFTLCRDAGIDDCAVELLAINPIRRIAYLQSSYSQDIPRA